MSMLWYVLYLGLIGAGLVAARVIGVREKRTERLKTQHARDKVQRVFDAGACQSYERLEAMGRRLAESLGGHDGAHQFTMAQLDRMIGEANRAYGHFGDTVVDAGAGSEQLQKALVEFCRKYSELGLLLGDVAQQTGHAISPDQRFLGWVQDDAAFARELVRLGAEPEFASVLRSVRGFFGADGFTASLSLKKVVTAETSEALLAHLQASASTPSVHLHRADRLHADAVRARVS